MEFIMQFLIDAVGGTLGFLIDLLPDSPFSNLFTDPPEMVNLSYIAWVIPFPLMAAHFAVFLLALAVYYVYRVLGRWLKVLRS